VNDSPVAWLALALMSTLQGKIMIIVLDNREDVGSGFVSCFDREGVAAICLSEKDFNGWLKSASKEEFISVEAVLVGECVERCDLAREVRTRSSIPLIALTESKSLSDTLDLFASGCDDVVRKPVHVREIIVRAAAIRQRSKGDRDSNHAGGIQIFLDGRDPVVDGEVMQLPRRERRILEYFVINKGRRVSKTQIYNFVYGLFSDEIEECVIESHISKLRKKLRHRLGVDPIDSQRYLGYRLLDIWSDKPDAETDTDLSIVHSLAQDEAVVMHLGKVLEEAVE
jgi:two-component system, OmpR family, flagellar system response regulator FtcR